MRQRTSGARRTARVALTIALLLAALLAWLPAPAPVAAASCTVTSPADTGNGTLRAALLNTGCSAITIALTGTIKLQSTLPIITRPLTIAGPGQANLTIQSNPAFAVASRFLLLFVDARAMPGMAVGISGLTLANGRAKANQFGNNYGGNLRSWQANLALTDVTLTGATGETDTGGAGAYLSGGSPTLTRVTVSGNSAPGYFSLGAGAGLFIDEGYGPADVTIINSTIVGNAATSYGGGGLAVVRDSGTTGRLLRATVNNSTIGTAAQPNTTNDRGAGIFVQDGALVLNGTTVSGNTASGIGGGLFVSNTLMYGSATATLTNSTFSGNAAYNGGGLSVNNYGSGGSVAATLTNSTASGNQSVGVGGALSLWNTAENGIATATFNSTTISGNRANIVGGGGLYVINTANSGGSANATLNGTTVSRNKAIGDGGGLLVNPTNVLVMLTNSTISGNTATGNGGGLAVVGFGSTSAMAVLRYTTVTLNVADADGDHVGIGGGLFRDNSANTNISVLSSIVAGNQQAWVDHFPDDCKGTLVSQGHNLWGGSSWCPNNSALGEQNLVTLNKTLGQVLVQQLAYNGGPTQTHALVAGSPAINHGDNAACATAQPYGAGGKDQRGVARPTNACDVGAYEAP